MATSSGSSPKIWLKFSQPYEISKYNSNEDPPRTYPLEMPPLLIDEDECLNFDWDGVLKDMKVFTIFKALKQYISRTCLPEVYPVIKYMLDEDDLIDSITEIL